eukprot:gene18502-21371_t
MPVPRRARVLIARYAAAAGCAAVIVPAPAGAPFSGVRLAAQLATRSDGEEALGVAM